MQYLKLYTLDIFDGFYKLGTERIKQSTEIHQIRYDNYSEEVVWHIVPSVTESLSLGEPSPRVPTDSRIKMQ